MKPCNAPFRFKESFNLNRRHGLPRLLMLKMSLALGLAASGLSLGTFSFSSCLASEPAPTKEPEHWWRVVKNIRAGVTPPAEASELSDAELEKLYDWVKFSPFKINPGNLAPGPVTMAAIALSRTLVFAKATIG